jgi:recombination protein RecA
LVQKSGSWYSYGGDRIGQGKDNVRAYLKEHPEIAQALEASIRAKAFGVSGGTPATQSPAPAGAEEGL